MVAADRVETKPRSPGRRQTFNIRVTRLEKSLHVRAMALNFAAVYAEAVFECPVGTGERPVRTATMQVLLRRSEFRQDIRCSVCGQGFRLYWELNSPSERATMRAIILGELRDHHSKEQGGDATSAAHPFDLFRLPGWSGSPKFSRKTLLAGPSRGPSDISKVVMISSRQPK
jgi:hypothetical protein